MIAAATEAGSQPTSVYIWHNNGGGNDENNNNNTDEGNSNNGSNSSNITVDVYRS